MLYTESEPSITKSLITHNLLQYTVTVTASSIMIDYSHLNIYIFVEPHKTCTVKIIG